MCDVNVPIIPIKNQLTQHYIPEATQLLFYVCAKIFRGSHYVHYSHFSLDKLLNYLMAFLTIWWTRVWGRGVAVKPFHHQGSGLQGQGHEGTVGTLMRAAQVLRAAVNTQPWMSSISRSPAHRWFSTRVLSYYIMNLCFWYTGRGSILQPFVED